MQRTNVRFSNYICKNRNIFQSILVLNFKYYVSYCFCIGEFQCSEEAVIIAAITQIQNVFITPMGEKSAAVSFTRIMKTGHFCLCGHKMAAWSINHDDRHCLFHIGTILKLKAHTHEMDEQHYMKYEILNIVAKY